LKRQGHLAGHVLVDREVFAADFLENPENILDVGVVEIERDFLARVDLSRSPVSGLSVATLLMAALTVGQARPPEWLSGRPAPRWARPDSG
jgi:hypothetical protein